MIRDSKASGPEAVVVCWRSLITIGAMCDQGAMIEIGNLRATRIRDILIACIIMGDRRERIPCYP